AFKPFVYTAALDNGWRISDTVIDSYIAIRLSDGRIWAPDNFDGTFSGQAMTLRDALRKSTNSIAVKLVNDKSIRSVGPATVIQYARRMGITTP
ncbi:MAG: penicillin-binding transpeptidase domain-containing protein, partial [Candidatus Latescibacterota bacterium]